MNAKRHPAQRFNRDASTKDLPRILLVEDESTTRELMARWFRDAGSTVIEAESGEEALNLAEARGGDLDVVVTDGVMSGIDGVALARQLARLKPALPVLLLTGCPALFVDRPDLPENICAVLGKPIGRDALVAKVLELLPRKFVAPEPGVSQRTHKTRIIQADADLPLIAAIAAGDETVVGDLMVRHQAALFHFTNRYLGNEAAARDVVQETFVRVYFRAARYRARATVKTWIYTIALNLCRDAARKRRSAPALVRFDQSPDASGQHREFPAETPTPFEATANREALVRLRQAITGLPEQLKASLVLFALEQRSQVEVAEILNISPKTVEMRVYHAKAKLRERMAMNADQNSAGNATGTTSDDRAPQGLFFRIRARIGLGMSGAKAGA